RVELAAAVVGHDDAVGPGLDRAARVIDLHDALEEQRAVPSLAQPGDVVPGHARVELAIDPGLDSVEIAGIGHLVGEAAEGMRAAAAGHVPQPARAGERLGGPDPRSPRAG